MRMWMLRFGIPTLLGLFVFVSPSRASSIFVDNFSFETLSPGGLFNTCGLDCSFAGGNVPGWNITGDSGLFQPGPPAGTTAFYNSVPDGVTIAYSSGGSISQTVAATVQLGVTYTLLVDVGSRKGVPEPGTEALVINGNTYLATGTLAAPGDWATFSVSYTGLVADVGSAITIRLSSSGVQAGWDDVRLSDSTGASLVPDPATSLLLGSGLILLGIITRKRRG